MGLARVLAIVGQKLSGEITATEMFEVHRQEAHVVDDVAPPQPVVELETIEDARTVVEAEHVVSKEVAVTVDDAATRDPLRQERTSAVNVPVGQASNVADQLSILHSEIQPVDLEQALLPQIMEGRRSRDARDLVTSRGPPMKGRNRSGDRVEAGGDGIAVNDHRGKSPILRHLAHQHRVIDDAALAHDFFDAEIDVGAELTVQFHLTTTVVLALGRGGEVDEAEVNWLLPLVDETVAEGESRNVRLDGLDSRSALVE
jgi:hypothetical protein